VNATGSYEGYLLMEGIPDHHEASSFTRGAHGWSWRSCRIFQPMLSRQKLEGTVNKQLP